MLKNIEIYQNFLFENFHRYKAFSWRIIILFRNLNLEDGFCNGMRLIVRSSGEYVIKADIITGNKAGITVSIPGIDLSPSKEEIPFNMIRRQFPIRLEFAMTINESQE